MSLKDFTEQLARIDSSVKALPPVDQAAMVAELRRLERQLQAILSSTKLEAWVAGPRGEQIGFAPIAADVSGFLIDLPTGIRVNPFETTAFVATLYAHAEAVVNAVEAQLDPTQRPRRLGESVIIMTPGRG